MGSIAVLFGRTRHRRRRVLAHDLHLGGIDPFGRPTFLYLTGTHRKRAQVLREFEGRDAFAPDVRVLGEHVADLWHRHGDGRAILTDRALALAARRMLLDQPDRFPRLAALGAAAADALAEAEELLAAHGALARDAEVRRAVDRLRERVPGPWARRAEAEAELARRVASPSPALLATLRRHDVVILDDLVGTTPGGARLVVALARAWCAAGAHVVLAFGAGRDRGGREAAWLLGWEEASDREPRAFAAAAGLRRVVMDELVASGEARVLVASADQVREIEPWTPSGAPLPRDLADALADGEPLPGAAVGPIRVLRASDRNEEARAVARGVKGALAGGAAPEDCVVAVADPATAAAVAYALEDHGVPFAMGGGLPVASTPLGVAVRRIAGLALDGFGPDLCALADRVAWPVPVDARTVRRWCVAAGVRGGRPRAWAERLGPWAVRARATDEATLAGALDALEALADRIAPLARDATAEAWRAALHEALTALDVGGRCWDDPAELHAWAAVVDAVDRLALDLLTADAGPWPAAALREALEEALATATVDPTVRSVARVPVVDVRELLGLTPAWTWMAGLAAGAFPAARPPSFVLEADEHRALVPDPVAVARHLLCALLRDALGDDRMRQVVLSWPATIDGRPASPSPLLAELLEVGGIVPEAPAEGPAMSTSDAVRAGWVDAGAVRAAALDRRGPLGRRDGRLDRPPPAPAEVSVTGLETYLRCPARFWYAEVLGLLPHDPWSPELEPRRRGTALHRILEAFLAARRLRALHGEPDPAGARAALHAVAAQVLDAVEAEGGFDPVFQRYARDRWLAGLVDERPGGVLRAWLDAEIARPGLAPEAVERRFTGLQVGPVRLRGVVDRIDRGPGGTRLVTDYKTGRSPTRREVDLGLSLQPVAYAEAMGGDGVAAAFLSLARPDDLRRTGFVGDPVALDAVCTAAERRTALALDRDGRAEVLGRAARAAQALVAGRFPPTPHAPDDAGCPTCPFRRICRVDPVRHGTAS